MPKGKLGVVDDAPSDLLKAHVGRFNQAVRSGDFAPMLSGFAPDAEMMFEGVPVGPFVGRDAIAQAYAQQPPTDEVRLLGTPRLEGDTVESDYAWASDGGRAGRMILTVRGGTVARLIVTFD
jgi:steroid delta-isomerase